MTPFHPDLHTFLMADGNTAALQAKTMADRDETQQECDERGARIDVLAEELLAVPDFVVEAISEADNATLMAIGLGASARKDEDIGIVVGTWLRGYAQQVATQKVDRG